MATEHAEEKLLKGVADWAEGNRREPMCGLCGLAAAKWKNCAAAGCIGQVWCDECNKIWHENHPERKEHLVRRTDPGNVKAPSSEAAQRHGTEVQAALCSLSAAPAAAQTVTSPLVRPTLAYLNKLGDGQCLCVNRALDGRLLVGRIKSLEIRTISGELLSSTETEGPVRGACELMGRFYWLIDKLSLGKWISVWDSRCLEEISSWKLPGGNRWFNLAVLGKMLVVPDPHHSQLLVYSSEGKLLSQHAVTGEPWYVSTSGTDIIVSDWRNNTVSVYDTSSSAYRLKFTYTGLKKPTAAAVSSDGHLYVGSLREMTSPSSLSKDNDKLHVVSAAGQLITKLQHEGLIWCEGLYITGDQLLAATGHGLHLYQLGR